MPPRLLLIVSGTVPKTQKPTIALLTLDIRRESESGFRNRFTNNRDFATD